MKNLLFLSILFVVISTNIYCQPPQSFKYQAVIRDADGEVMANQAVNVRISIHDGSAGGSVVYSETFAETTNQFGLINLSIGQGTPVSGTFSGINWSHYSKFIEVEIDTGSGYVSLGTSELLSVPYALYSERTSGGDWNSSGTNLYYDGGFVGIGTSNPITDLVVKSSGYSNGVLVYSNDDDPLFRVRQNSDASGGIYIYDNEGNPEINLNASFDSYIKGKLSLGDISSLGRLTIGTQSGSLYNFSFEKGIVLKDGDYNMGNDLEIQNSAGDMHFVVTDNGMVGIGLDSPQAKLHIKGTGYPYSFLFIQSDDNQDAGIRLYEGDSPNWHIYNNSALDGLQISNSNGSQTVFFADQQSGEVCIGTVTPATGYKLSVDGKIACEEVLVQFSDDWPDYVFDDNYKLPTLETLGTEIKKQKHLPGLPSACEVKENGIQVAEMQKALLEKVEELTLYIINQDKKIKNLQEEINILKGKKINHQ